MRNDHVVLKRYLAVPAIAFVVTSGLVLSGCAPKGSGAAGSGEAEADSETYSVESAVESVNSALADAEQSPTVALGRPVEARTPRSFAGLLIPSAYAGTCGADRFDPPLGSASCAGSTDDKTVLSVFDDCSGGPRDRFSLTGTITLTFDAAATCDNWIDALPLPTSGSVVRTSSDFTRHNPNGSTVTRVSDEHQNYLGETVSGGVKTEFGLNQRRIHILGLHTVRTGPDGNVVFDHSVRTDDENPLIVTGTRMENNRRVSDGKLKLDHNILGYTLETELAGLFWTSDCCHPVDGKITFTRSGSKTGTKTVDFGTGVCGQVTVTDDAGTTETVELPACE